MKEPSINRSSAKAGLLYLAALVVLSVVFYRERIFVDESFVGHLIINAGKLQIQVQRYGSFITQLFPLTASSLHLPLGTVFLIYSVSFNLFYLCVGLILFFRFREYELAILLAFYFSLMVSDSFFWTYIELHQGVGWMMLMFGFIRARSPGVKSQRPVLRTALDMSGFVILAVLAIYSHPSVLIPLGFLWAFLWMKEKGSFLNGPRRALVCSFSLCLIVWAKLGSSAGNYYDGGMISRLVQSSFADILATFQSGLADVFWKGLWHNYWILPLLFIAGLICLIRERRWLLVAWVIFGNLGFFVLLCLTFGNELTQFYFEGEFSPFAMIGTAAFVFFGLAYFKTRQAAYTFFALLFLVRLGYILQSSEKFRARMLAVAHISKYMQQQGINKMVIERMDNRLEDTLIMGWSLPNDVATFSVMNGDPVTKTCVNFTKEQMERFVLGDSRRDIYGPFEVDVFGKANRHYFRYDTQQVYRVVTYDQVFTQ